ncbi:hypothetical protein [Yersinia enterocolitica]|uniref:hypothetical protein n=1 Tax=Yersinia enterocolitica TaxID=630 RepID=UPI001C608BBD|nr:hypothetical protein [Yersinia enterocolitica]MBW5821263.1 hypothetical protein [Yersinia enterocolitica]MBW5849266.1 hypothetical protein [Yersinia enterocolitica]MBW5867246.1 hypothetical protein [Yersinia enterocolitica]MBW5875083.1 hypothetical protein [Yersinia enterocolitica]
METEADWTIDYWDALIGLEINALTSINDTRKEWEELAKKCMTLAIKSAFLQGKDYKKETVRTAFAFLKRTMTDFRGAWLLINLGYPYQAACIAASLYENSLLVNCLSNDEQVLKELKQSPHGDVPWGACKLAKMAAQKDVHGFISKKEPKDDKYQKAWKLSYLHYKWLCKIKHPTIQQVKDEMDTARNGAGKFVVIPYPDARDANVGTKEMILIICISKLLSAAKNIADAQNCLDGEPKFVEFKKLAVEVYDDLKVHITKSRISDSPIKVHDFAF